MRARGVLVVASDTEKATLGVMPGVPVERCGLGVLNPNDTCGRRTKTIKHCRTKLFYDPKKLQFRFTFMHSIVSYCKRKQQQHRTVVDTSSAYLGWCVNRTG